MIHLKFCPKEDYCVTSWKLDICSCSVLNTVNAGIFPLENMWRCNLCLPFTEKKSVFLPVRNAQFYHRGAQETSDAFLDN